MQQSAKMADKFKQLTGKVAARAHNATCWSSSLGSPAAALPLSPSLALAFPKRPRKPAVVEMNRGGVAVGGRKGGLFHYATTTAASAMRSSHLRVPAPTRPEGGKLRAPKGAARAKVGCGSSSSADVATAASAATGEEAMSGADIRRRFIDFYVSRGHKQLPSSSLVPDDPTVLLTIAGMLQFKPIFLGQEKKKYDCCTTTQKCVRTNDIENVGVTARHHTFFEMLGNFSFGDYFKKGAIRYAWELCTTVFPLDPQRIWVSVFEDDDESFEIWEKVVGVPRERIVRMGEKYNFWSSGPTGPCGPCTELYYDFKPELGPEGADLEDDDRFIEFYNLVFMQYNRTASGELEPLEAKCVDTGMGLERMAQILQGKPNNYETDLIFPLIEKACSLAGKRYSDLDERSRQACKVIGDHTRAVVYLISDGVTPSNIGRGYIVRRLLRRVVLKGRLLGVPRGETFTPEVAKIAVEMSPGCDPEVRQNEQRVLAEMAREEQRFCKTLDRGEAILEDLLAAGGEVSGADAFMLYDTYGFPLEITQELAWERGVAVDVAGFETAMEEARLLSRSAHEQVDMTLNDYEGDLAKSVQPTEFCGYGDNLRCDATILAIVDEGKQRVGSSGEGSKVKVVLDRTTFYAESGGQVGDKGSLVTSSGARIDVHDVQKAAGGLLHLHEGVVSAGTVSTGESVSAAVDETLRRGCNAHHTSTHLLQAALKQVLGDDVCQAGSIVKPDSLRFDFNYPEAMTADQVREVERLVNGWVAERNEIVVEEMPIAEAKARGATAMFGEKYGETVRVVDVVSAEGKSASMELCGGTHVERTQEIRGLKIVSESGIASGIRRIEAVAGDRVMDYLGATDDIVKTLSSQLKTKREEIVPRITTLMGDLRASQAAVAKLKEELAVAKTAALAGKVSEVNGLKAVIESIDDMDPKSLSAAAQQLQSSLGEDVAVVLVTKVSNKKVSLVAAFGGDLLEKKMHAGKFVSSMAEICGGKGGGRPNLAQAGGTNAAKIEEALEFARAQFYEQTQ